MGGRRWALVVALGLFCGLAANLYASWQYELPPIIDQQTYQWQAAELADGNLTVSIPAATNPEPQFGVRIVDERAIFKYMPGTAALAATSKALTGAYDLGFIFAVAMLVTGTAALGRAMRLSPAGAILGGVLLGLSPMVLSIGSLTLSYVPAMAASVWACALVVRETDRHQPARARLIAAGVLFGVALFFRQVEPLLWFGVTLVWLARRRDVRSTLPVLGGFVVIATLAALTVVAITHSLQPPFFVVSPEDGFGFGDRRISSYDGYTNFTPGMSLNASLITLRAAVLWGPASVLGAALAAYGYQRISIERRRLLLSLGSAIVGAYAFHWSIANAVSNRAIDLAGPFYYLGVVIVVAVAAGHGAIEAVAAIRRQRRAPMLAGLAIVPLLGLALVSVHNGVDTAQGDPIELQPEAWDTFIAQAALATDEPFVALADISYAGDTGQIEAAEDHIPRLAGTNYVRFEDPAAVWASMRSCEQCQLVLFTQRLISRYSQLLSAPSAVPLSVQGDEFSHPIHANLFGKEFNQLVLGVSFDGFFYQALEWNSTSSPAPGAVTVDGSHVVINLGSRRLRVQPPAGASQLTIRLIASLDGNQVAVGELRTPIQRTLAGIEWVVPMQAFSGTVADRVGAFELHLSNG